MNIASRDSFWITVHVRVVQLEKGQEIYLETPVRQQLKAKFWLNANNHNRVRLYCSSQIPERLEVSKFAV